MSCLCASMSKKNRRPDTGAYSWLLFFWVFCACRPSRQTPQVDPLAKHHFRNTVIYCCTSVSVHLAVLVLWRSSLCEQQVDCVESRCLLTQSIWNDCLLLPFCLICFAQVCCITWLTCYFSHSPRLEHGVAFFFIYFFFCTSPDGALHVCCIL